MSEQSAIKKKATYKTLSWVCYGLGVILILINFIGINGREERSLLLIIGGVVLFGFGIMFKNKAHEVYEEEAEDIQGRISVRGFETAYKRQLVEEGHAEQETAEEIELRHIERETIARSFLTQQTQLLNEDVTTRQATQLGRPADAHKDIIREAELLKLQTTDHEERARIDLQTRWQEIVQDLDSADLLEMSEQQLLKKLRDNLLELYRQQNAAKKGDDAPAVKKKIAARYTKDIDFLERLIDARQAGHFLQEDKEKVRRLAEGSPNSRSDYPPADGEDEY